MSGRTIREVLGHTSWQMQEHYSRIADDTLRREYEEKYEVRFNLKGEAVKIHRDSDLSGVEWLAEKIGRRLHAVAGGWCGRHISRPCPKTAADGCYFCDDFQTDRQFLHVHRDTLARTRELQADAAAARDQGQGPHLSPPAPPSASAGATSRGRTRPTAGCVRPPPGRVTASGAVGPSTQEGIERSAVGPPPRERVSVG
ncbi:hypothetical protein [Streptomyces sp. NPDC002785]|uniref:hypothetical protein n=1 Tax=Streptomyces sp. NPDC002785 TaxID=3154543 RepID=UPI00332F794B